MISTGLLFGVYGYLLFFLGVYGVLDRSSVLLMTIGFLLILFLSFAHKFQRIPLGGIRGYLAITDKVSITCLLLLSIMILVNFLGAVGPELAFDALWYHLTLPNIYLSLKQLVFIPGGLLYYSAMPKMGEMLFMGGLVFGSPIFPKLLHFGFGILTLLVTYAFARRFVSKEFSLLACVIFYTNLVVGWESTTAYVDLIWTFYITASLYLLFRGIERKDQRDIYLSSIFIGISVAVKLVSILNVVFFFSALFIANGTKRKQTLSFVNLLIYLGCVLVVPLPWLLFSWIHTGTPVYPFFSSIYRVDGTSLMSADTIIEYVKTFFVAPDPISPLYVAILPLGFYLYANFKKPEKRVLLTGLAASLSFFLFPRSGGSRFLLQYLPFLSIVVVLILDRAGKNQATRLVSRIFLTVVFILMLTSIIYRGFANSKFLPVAFGLERTDTFLSRQLNFSFGDFADTDKFFQKTIKLSDVVLLYGFHNLAYVDFPFIDQSFVKVGDRFNFIATQHTSIPDRFENFHRIYENTTTGVRVYKGDKWVNY